MILDEFFTEYEASRSVFDALHAGVLAIGPADVRVTKSQVAFRRVHAFAWAWVPDRYFTASARRWCSRSRCAAVTCRPDGSRS
jgi:hypothetical protein